jgi:spore maturation protein CgeB
MGHSVATFNDQHGLGIYHKSILARGYRKLTKRLIESHRLNHVNAFMKAAEEARPDIIVILKGLYIGSDDVVALRRTGAWTVNLCHDDFFSPNLNNWTMIQRRALPAYDFLFTTREVNVNELRPLNPRVEFFPFAYYPRIHCPVEIPSAESDVWRTDVAFVGTWEKERCQLLESLVQAVPAKYGIWGSQWEKVSRNSPLRPFIHNKEIWMTEMAKAIGGAKISLAFLRKQSRDDFTQRTFEIPACNGVFLAERTERHMQFYQEGKEAEFFDPGRSEELINKVRSLLRDDSHRESVRKAGREALLKQNHTYKKRLERLLELYAHARPTSVANAAHS